MVALAFPAGALSSALKLVVVAEEHLSAGIISALQWSGVHFFHSSLVTPFGMPLIFRVHILVIC